jgi:hypothetical protein
MENKSNGRLEEAFNEAFDGWKVKHDCCCVDVFGGRNRGRALYAPLTHPRKKSCLG